MGVALRIPFIGIPVLLMIVAVPLILNKVPKNPFFGFRTPKTMSGSDEQWYRANREVATAIFIAASVSLLAWFVVPSFVHEPWKVVEICGFVLGLSLALACGIEIVKYWK